MALGVSLILACMEHMMPEQEPNSWHCRLAAFRASQAGHFVSLGLQFLGYFGCIMVLHWAFVSWRRFKIRNRIPEVRMRRNEKGAEHESAQCGLRP